MPLGEFGLHLRGQDRIAKIVDIGTTDLPIPDQSRLAASIVCLDCG